MENINLNLIIKELSPSKKEEKEAKKIINSITKKINIPNARISPGGSWAKNTNLKGNHDIDIYVKFNYKVYEKKDLSKILEKELRKHFKIEKLHGSRDYFQIKAEPYTVEIIPILEIKEAEDAKNITDISPLHVKYVNKNKKYCNQIRLTKRFAKVAKVYGAESYIKGFSGYVLEILTIKYKSFNNLIKQISGWDKKTSIGTKKLINNLNRSKKTSPLILIDPVDPNRNAAAALSQKQYDQLIATCKNYLKNPSQNFFREKTFDINDIKRRNKTNRIITLKVIPLKKKKDVAGAKMIKAFNYIITQLEKNEFKIKNEGWIWDKDAAFYFILDKKTLPKTIKHYGPRKDLKKAVISFKEKWKGKKIFTEKNRMYVLLKRKYREPENLIKELIKEEKFKEFVKEIKIN